MVSLEILSIRDRCLSRSISAACRRELSETLEGIEGSLVVVYSRKCSASGVGKELLAHGSRTMENIPPTKAALLQHVRHQPKRHCCNMCDARHSKRGMCGHRRLFRSLSCLLLHFGGGSHLIRGGNPFGLN